MSYVKSCGNCNHISLCVVRRGIMKVQSEYNHIIENSVISATALHCNYYSDNKK